MARWFLIVACIFSVGTAQAAADLADVGKFGLGFASGVLIHEAGHAVLTYAEGAHVRDWGFQHVTSDTSDPAKNRVIALGGYLAQSMATEVVVQSPGLHSNPYALGIMSLGIYVNLSNVVKYYAFDQQNDLALYAAEGGNPAAPATAMTLYSLFTLYRIKHNTDILAYLSSNVFSISIKF